MDIKSARSFTSSEFDRSKLVVEIGEDFTKFGFAGEFSPKGIIRTKFETTSESYNSDDILYFTRQSANSNLNDEKAYLVLKKYIQHIFKLALASSATDIIIVEDIFIDIRFKDALCKIILNDLKRERVMFVPTFLAATYPFNTSSALIVNIGYSDITVVSIVEGVTLLHSSQSISTLGTKALLQRTKKLLKQHGRFENTQGDTSIDDDDFPKLESLGFIETVLTSHAFCTSASRSAAYKTEEGPEKKSSDTSISFDGKRLIVPGFVRETIFESLFDATLSEDQQTTLPEVIHDVVESLPRDTKKMMFGNIIVTGSLSGTPGLLFRLKEEIQRISTERKLKTTEVVNFYQFDGTNTNLFLEWLGASILASASVFVKTTSLARKDYLEGKKPADWTQQNVKRI